MQSRGRGTAQTCIWQNRNSVRFWGDTDVQLFHFLRCYRIITPIQAVILNEKVSSTSMLTVNLINFVNLATRASKYEL